MKALMPILTLALARLSASAFAANAACEAQAKEKKLAGAAHARFMKKCEADAGGRAAACDKHAGGGTAAPASAASDKQADDKKLAGAARTSFLKKCVTDAGG